MACAALLAAALASVAAAQDAATADLPITRVVLFTTGVGYFEHSGTVVGSQQLDLPVATDQMDDLLQSLVVQDLDGGTVRPVRYPSQDPLGRLLAGYRLDLSGDPTLAQLLSQARGEAVHVEASQPLDGTVVNVETVASADGPSTYLTLLTADGLRRIDLAEVRDVRFRDAAVQADLEAALAAIAGARSHTGATVRVLFSGEGTRRVRIGYVRAMPVWKTSYRLVLTGSGRADLQGWAIVDNPTDLDLDRVQLSLVAGRPISFVTGLYDPIYVQRPRVTLDLGTLPVAPVYGSETAPAAKSADAAIAPSALESRAGLAAPAPAAPQLSGSGVAAMAQGVDGGANFEYRVDQPVTIARHESAMIPIVLASVPARELAIYDPAVLSDHPLSSVRLTNDTGLHLAGGPVTVLDAGGFSGDARLADVVPGDARVLSYAVDLGVDVTREGSDEPQRVSAVALRNGTVVTTLKQRLRTRYTLTSRDGQARFVVLDHAKRAGYAVVAPAAKPAETASSYRFGVALRGADGSSPAPDATVPTVATCDAGAPCTVDVVTERTVEQSLAVSNVATDDLAFYLANVELSPADRATLAQVLDLKQRIAALGRQVQQLQAQIDGIFQDQSRIRQNMAALDLNSALYRRYASDLEAQENRLADLRGSTDDLRQKQTELQTQLDALLASLTAGS